MKRSYTKEFKIKACELVLKDCSKPIHSNTNLIQ